MSIKLPIILIDNGHGKDTPGKRSPDASNGLVNSPYYFREYQWARKCAQGICDVLTFEGYTAFLLVKEEEDIPLRERTERIKAYCRTYGAENVIVVSIHVNAAAGSGWHDARGLSIYTSPGVTKSDTLATCIYNAAKKELTERTYGNPYGNTFGKKGKQKPIRSDWSDGDSDYEAAFWMLVRHPATAVLVEHMFQDNKEDVAWLKSSEGLGSCIHFNVEGIETYVKKYWSK